MDLENRRGNYIDMVKNYRVPRRKTGKEIEQGHLDLKSFMMSQSQPHSEKPSRRRYKCIDLTQDCRIPKRKSHKDNQIGRLRFKTYMSLQDPSLRSEV